MVDFSAPFDLVSGLRYPATSLISMNELPDAPGPIPQQEYVGLEDNKGKEKADQVRKCCFSTQLTREYTTSSSPFSPLPLLSQPYTQPVQPYTNVVPLEDKAQGSVTFRTYYKFFIAGGGYLVNLILVIAFLMTEVRGINCPVLWSVCVKCVLFVWCVLLSRAALWCLTGTSRSGECGEMCMTNPG